MSVSGGPCGFRTGVVKGDNVNFSGDPGVPGGQVTTNGQLLIGATAFPNIRVGTLTSTGGTITVTPGAGTLNIDLAGGSVGVDSVAVQAATAPGTNPVLPTGAGLLTINGAAVAAAGIPVRSDSIAANTLQIEVQRTSSSVATNATAQGLSSYNSVHFLVDANGWVSNLNGVSASAFDVQANTAPGTDPVLPNASGVVQVNGTIIASHAIPLRTNSLAANAYNIEAQYSNAAAADLGTNAGMCSFNNTQFSVSATGFVSSLSGTAPWLDSAGGALVNHTGYFATAAAVYTLPAGVANGDMVEIVDTVGGGVVVTASGADIIQIQNVASSAGGTATSSQQGDSLRLSFRLADLTWYCCPGAGGIWVLA